MSTCDGNSAVTDCPMLRPDIGEWGIHLTPNGEGAEGVALSQTKPTCKRFFSLPGLIRDKTTRQHLPTTCFCLKGFCDHTRLDTYCSTFAFGTTESSHYPAAGFQPIGVGFPMGKIPAPVVQRRVPSLPSVGCRFQNGFTDPGWGSQALTQMKIRGLRPSTVYFFQAGNGWAVAGVAKAEGEAPPQKKANLAQYEPSLGVKDEALSSKTRIK